MGARTLEELPAWAHGLLERGRVARLGLLDSEDRPRVLPVTYAVHDRSIWSAIDQKPKRPGEPARLRFLRRRPEAALTVDHYEEDWTALAWVQVLGEVEVVDARDASAALGALVAKYEQYRLQAPPGPFLRLVPARALWWRAAPL